MFDEQNVNLVLGRDGSQVLSNVNVELRLAS